MKSLILKDYFEIIKPEYVFLKLTPSKSIRNYDSDKIAKAIGAMYRNLLQNFKKHNNKLFFEVPSKVAYYIYIEKNQVNFYFIIPKSHMFLLKDKINDTWKHITITKVDSLPNFSKDAVKYKLTYRKEDAMSLATDKRTNTLLSSILNVIDVMQEGDKIGVFYNFEPIGQYTWRANYDRTIKKLNDNYPIDREKFSVLFAVKMLMSILMDMGNVIMDSAASFLGGKSDEKQAFFTLPFLQQEKPLLPSTKQKRETRIIDTQIVVFSESADRLRQSNNVFSLCESFKSITGDNELVYKRHNGKVDIMQRHISGVDSIKTSVEECQNFIALPGRELINNVKNIEHINTTECEVPKELQSGVMCIGVNTYKGNTTKAYLSNDKEYKNLTLVVCGPTRAGKTTLISNLTKNSIDNNETTIIFDFCGNCELSKDVSKSVQKSLVIDCSNFDTLQGFGYNEITPSNKNPFEIYRCAKAKTTQLMTLINCVNESDTELRARMERYLESASIITFLSNGGIKDVFSILQNHAVRHKYIDMIPSSQFDNTEEYVSALNELDDYNKNNEIVGTRLVYVQGILNRVNKLKQNTYMELMLKKSCKNNINLIDEMQKAQLISIRMPEVMFSTEQEKDIYCTYWITKIWGALQKRKWDIDDADKRVKVNIVFDELYQVPQCQNYLKSKLSQIAKFGAKPIISCHYLGQIPNIRNELKAANSSYMVLQGADKDNFKELKEELAPFELEDLLNLKRYHSLNLIKYEKGWAKFITKMPSPIR